MLPQNKPDRFMAEFRLKASTDMAHHAALAPNSPDGSRPSQPSHSQNAVDLLALAAPLSRKHQINSSAAMLRAGRTRRQDLVPASVELRSIAGNGIPSAPPMSRAAGCSINRSAGSYEPILRVLGAALSSWARSSHQPTADPCPHDAPPTLTGYSVCQSCSALWTPHGAGTPSSRRPFNHQTRFDPEPLVLPWRK